MTMRVDDSKIQAAYPAHSDATQSVQLAGMPPSQRLSIHFGVSEHTWPGTPEQVVYVTQNLPSPQSAPVAHPAPESAVAFASESFALSPDPKASAVDALSALDAASHASENVVASPIWASPEDLLASPASVAARLTSLPMRSCRRSGFPQPITRSVLYEVADPTAAASAEMPAHPSRVRGSGRCPGATATVQRTGSCRAETSWCGRTA